MYDVNFIEPKSDSEKRQELLDSINRYSDNRLTSRQKEVLQRAIENLPNILDAQELFDWLTIARADFFNFDYTPVYSNSKIAVLKNSEILGGCINPKINEATGQRDYLNENKLIIGDNFDVLNNLLLTHKGKIDVIYIDPPYNTDSMKNDGNHADERLLETLDQKTEEGKSKFIYNDSFYRDDWLSMMKVRLEKAKKLMSPGGGIFVSIDDSEQAYLKVLMDEIFGEENFICNFIVALPDGNNINQLSINHEYCLMYSKGKEFNKRALSVPLAKEEIFKTRLTKNGNKKSTITFPKGLKIIPSGDYEFIGNVGGSKEPITFDGKMIFKNGYLVNDIDLTAEWAVPEILKKIFKGETCFDSKGSQYTMPFFNSKGNLQLNKIKTTEIIRSVQYFATGTAEVEKILDITNFSYPKSINLIKFLLTILNNKNAIVLDFFAGSGTTGQAVMDLNREDGGNRKFILCTNNQNKIAETVCVERLYRVITGKTSDGKSDFDWIKNNEAYSNESIGIYETKIMDLDFDPKVSNVKSVQDLGNDAIRVYSQFSNEIINENVFNALTTLPIIERKED